MESIVIVSRALEIRHSFFVFVCSGRGEMKSLEDENDWTLDYNRFCRGDSLNLRV